MNKKIMLIVVSVCFFNLFINAQQDSLFNYILKGNKGSKTVLSVHSSNGNKIGTQTFEIIDKYQSADTAFQKIQNTITGMGTIKLTYAVKSYDNNSYIELKDYLDVASFVKSGIVKIDPWWMIMPSEFIFDEEFVGYNMVRDYGNTQMTTKMTNRKVVGIDTLKTNAGEFECIKMTYTIEATNGYGVFVSNYIDWYNKDLGLIRQEAYTKEGKIENSFILQSIDIK